MIALEAADRGEPSHRDALFDRLVELVAVCRHPLAVAAVDDDGVGRAEAARGAGGVERGVATAVDRDAPPELGRVVLGDLVQERDRVEDPRGVAGRDVHALGQLCADAEEHGVEAAFASFLFDVVHGVVELDLDAEGDDALDLRVEDRRAAVGRRESRSASCRRVAAPTSTSGRGVRGAAGGRRHSEPAGSAADDEDALARVGAGAGQRPAALDREVAEESLDGVDADRLVELGPVARGLARVVADSAHHRWEGIVVDELAPRGLIVAGLGVVEPLLDVLPCRAAVVARRQPIDVDRSLDAPRTGLVGVA